MELVIVTGMSGAGKSQTVRALEDIGYYCVDNMPPQLIPKFVELCSQSGGAIRRVALVMDVRGGEMFSELRDSLTSLTEAGQGYRILFLDCTDEVLCRRFDPAAGEKFVDCMKNAGARTCVARLTVEEITGKEGNG